MENSTAENAVTDGLKETAPYGDGDAGVSEAEKGNEKG